eukprot:scaffold3128_cov121-Isochrysis_galbana.AAC.1
MAKRKLEVGVPALVCAIEGTECSGGDEEVDAKEQLLKEGNADEAWQLYLDEEQCKYWQTVQTEACRGPPPACLSFLEGRVRAAALLLKDARCARSGRAALPFTTPSACFHRSQANSYQGPYISQGLPLARVKRLMKVASCFNPRVRSQPPHPGST